MDFDERFIKVAFPLPADGDGWPPVDTETLWAEKAGDELVLANVPMYVFEVSMGDTIEVESTEGFPTFKGVVKRGGHSTVRIVPHGDGKGDEVINQLDKMGCTIERSGILVAIDIPPSVDALQVRDILYKGLADDQFGLEEADVSWLEDADG